ncbi:response regulator, partial [Siccirubricoccus deserti]
AKVDSHSAAASIMRHLTGPHLNRNVHQLTSRDLRPTEICRSSGSQVYGIARQAGGAVRIESRPGEGTTVRIYLPTTEASFGEENAQPVDRQIAADASATILVIDDDPDVRRVLVASLDALGYRVLEAADGPSGLAVLEEAAPELMIVDFAMPGMNGAEVAGAARKLRPDLPIVFVSGYADTAAIERIVGPDTLMMRKPFRIDELQAVLAGTFASRL